jgi:hypothetical protein
VSLTIQEALYSTIVIQIEALDDALMIACQASARGLASVLRQLNVPF